VLVQLGASALSAIGFVFKAPVLMIVGTVFWLAWFAVLFLIAKPETDQLLQNQMRWLRPAALTLFVILVLAGLGEIAFVCAGGLREESSTLMTSFRNIFMYNDATALCHQATENLIDGNNPYTKANVVTAMQKFNGDLDKLTLLRQGRFADVFPYPQASEVREVWQQALDNPEHIPPEFLSKLC
jgi:hypothetical protein